jgi:hypothetical protein
MRFVGVAGGEARPVQPRETYVVEGEARRQRRNRPLSVARGALAFCVAARAEIASACGARSMLADPVAVVDQVVVGQGALGRQIDVTTVAVAKRPLVPVPVTAEATGHLRQHRIGSLFGHFHMAVDAIACRCLHVLGVREAQVFAREFHSIPHVLFPVASHAWPRVMGLLVAANAGGVSRHVHRPRMVRGLHARMALDAVDPLEYVSPVLEGVGLRHVLDAQDARAASEHDREREQPNGHPADHGNSSARERRTRAFVS